MNSNEIEKAVRLILTASQIEEPGALKPQDRIVTKFLGEALTPGFHVISYKLGSHSGHLYVKNEGLYAAYLSPQDLKYLDGNHDVSELTALRLCPLNDYVDILRRSPHLPEGWEKKCVMASLEGDPQSQLLLLMAIQNQAETVEPLKALPKGPIRWFSEETQKKVKVESLHGLDTRSQSHGESTTNGYVIMTTKHTLNGIYRVLYKKKRSQFLLKIEFLGDQKGIIGE